MSTATSESTSGPTSSAPDVSVPPAAERDAALIGILAATAEAVAADPVRAHVRFAASGTAVGAVATDIAARQHRFVVDEPATLGGDDSATNPVEYALGALLGCQVVSYRFWAAHLGIQVDSIDVSAVGDLDVRGFFGLDESARAGFSEIRLEARVSGPEVAERYAELQRVVDAHCPVLDLFSNRTAVRTTLVVDGA